MSSNKFWPFASRRVDASSTSPNNVINSIQNRLSPRHHNNHSNTNNAANNSAQNNTNGDNRTFLSELFRAKDTSTPSATSTTSPVTSTVRIDLFTVNASHGTTVTAQLTYNTNIVSTSNGVYKFYRCRQSHNADFNEIQSSTRNTYLTTIDDINNIVVGPWKSAVERDSVYVQSNFAHVGPIECEYGVQAALNEYINNTDQSRNVSVTNLHTKQPMLLQLSALQRTLVLTTLKTDEVDVRYSLVDDVIVFTVDTVDNSAFVLSCNKTTYYLQCDSAKTRDVIGLYIRHLIEKYGTPTIDSDVKDVDVAFVVGCDVQTDGSVSVNIALLQTPVTPPASAQPVVEPVILPTPPAPTTPVRQVSNVAQPVAVKRKTSSPATKNVAQPVGTKATPPPPSPSPPPALSQQPPPPSQHAVPPQTQASAPTSDKQLHAQIDDLRAEKQLLSDERNRMYDQYNKLDTDAQKQQQVLQAEISSLKQHFSKLQQQQKQTVDERNTAWNDINTLKTQLQAASMIQANNANAEVDLANKLRQVKDERAVVAQQQTVLSAERQQLNDTITQLNQANTALNSELVELKRVNEQQSQLHAQQLQHISTLASQIDALNTDVSNARKKQAEAENVLKQQLSRQRVEMEKTAQYVQRIDELELECHRMQRDAEAHMMNTAMQNGVSGTHTPQHTTAFDYTPVQLAITVQVAAAESTAARDDSATLPPRHDKRMSQSVSFNELLQQMQQHAKQHNHTVLDNDTHKHLVEKAELFGQLQQSYNELDRVHSDTVQQLHKLQQQQQQRTTRPAQANGTNTNVVELTQQLAALQAKSDELTANRNYFKSKVGTLSQTVEQLTQQIQTLQAKPSAVQQETRQVSPSAMSVHEKQLSKELKAKTKQLKEALVTVDYYKQVFEEQNLQLRGIQQDNLMLQRNSVWQGGLSSVLNTVNQGAVPVAQFDMVKQLCSSLTETVSEQQRAINDLNAKLRVSQQRENGDGQTPET